MKLDLPWVARLVFRDPADHPLQRSGQGRFELSLDSSP